MHSWLDVRPAVLDEIVGLDGPGDRRIDLCSLCSNDKSFPLYRCIECSYGSLFCGECVVKAHKALPLHRLEVCSQLARSPRAHTVPSVGRTGFSTGPLYIHLRSSVISGMEVPPALSIHNLTTSSSSTSMVGTKCKSDSALVGQVLRNTNAIVNYFECAGIRHLSIGLEPRSPSTFLRHITK